MVLASVWYINNANNKDVNISNLSIEPRAYESTSYECDGRQYCSQMTSCEEATYFLNNCDDPKMDGNGDGVPCERQWCN